MEIVNLKSPFDELKLETAVFVPKNTPKAIIQFSHGMSEHKERYFDFINAIYGFGVSFMLIYLYEKHKKDLEEYYESIKIKR